ncbi:MAG: EpsG family protein [Pseudomonadota bacterium]
MISEYDIYVLLLAVTLVVAVVRMNSTAYHLLIWPLLFFYSYTVRNAGFDQDVGVYVGIFTSPWSLESIYFLREPVFWLSSQYLNTVLGTPEATLILLDMVSFAVLYLCQRLLGMPRFFILLYLILFPAVMGMQNIYRQHLATIFCLCALALARKNHVAQYPVMILAVLTHNVAGLFVPLLFARRSGVSPSLWMMLGMLMVMAVVPLFLESKSFSDSGGDLRVAYLSAVTLLVGTIMLSYRMRITEEKARDVWMLVYFLLLSFYGTIILGPAQAERVCMICIVLALPSLFRVMDAYFRESVALRCVAISVMASATFMFSAVTQFMN